MLKNNSFDIVTDPEFATLIPPASEQELSDLEASILRDGCTDPLIVWKDRGIIVDGHNRKRICDKFGLPYAVCELPFSTRVEVADWIDARQLGRRNLTPDQMSLLRGRRYNRRKKKQGGTGTNQYNMQSGQNVHSAKSAEKIAEEHGVNEKTIRRDGKFAAALEKLGAAEEAVLK